MEKNEILGIDITRTELLKIGFYKKTFLQKGKEKTLYIFGENMNDCGNKIDAIEFDPDTQNIRCNHGTNGYYHDEQFVNSMYLINHFISTRGIKEVKHIETKLVDGQFSLYLISAGMAKLRCVKTTKEVLGIGLREAKNLVDKVPCLIKSNISKREAELMKAKYDTWEDGIELEIK